MRINFKDIPEGLHYAKLSDIKEKTGIYGHYLKLIFTITEGELSHYHFCANIKPTQLRQSKFYKWVTNILGREPDSNFCTDQIIGKKCMIYLTQEKEYCTVSDVFMENRDQ